MRIGPVGAVLCGFGGIGVGVLWGISDCYDSAKSTRDRDLANSVVERNDCIDDAALHFERCLEDAGLGDGRK
jgi:hypothetical protein